MKLLSPWCPCEDFHFCGSLNITFDPIVGGSYIKRCGFYFLEWDMPWYFSLEWSSIIPFKGWVLLILLYVYKGDDHCFSTKGCGYFISIGRECYGYGSKALLHKGGNPPFTPSLFRVVGLKHSLPPLIQGGLYLEVAPSDPISKLDPSMVNTPNTYFGSHEWICRFIMFFFQSLWIFMLRYSNPKVPL